MRPGSRAVVAAVVATIALAGAGQAAAAVPGLCDPVMPKSSVTAGMTGTGYTVEHGRVVEPFSVTILGTLKDGIAPGRDMIIVEVDSPAVQRAGGIWAGMSGSPVYVGGQLVGAVAYGLASTSSGVGGLTPAEDMLGLLGLPGPALAASMVSVDAPSRVQLHGSLARTVVARANLASSSAAALTQLKVPLSVSGLTPRGLDRVSSFITTANPGLVPVAGSSSSKTISIAPPPPMPGQSFASVASYGETSVAAVGTITYVCDGVALAFGHPFEFGGNTTPTGASAADAITVVPDIVQPYKLANVAESLGTVDQDRLAGIRATFGAAPATFPVHSVVNAPDLGRRHEGESQIAMADWASTVTLYQLFGELEATADSAGTGFDSAGKGTVSAWWTFQGTREDGTPWSISRGNRWVSKLGVDFTAAFQVAIQLDTLIANTVEDVKVTNVKVSLTREAAFNLYSVKRLLVSKNGGRFRSVSSLGRTRACGCGRSCIRSRAGRTRSCSSGSTSRAGRRAASSSSAEPAASSSRTASGTRPASSSTRTKGRATLASCSTSRPTRRGTTRSTRASSARAAGRAPSARCANPPWSSGSGRSGSIPRGRPRRTTTSSSAARSP